MVEVSLFIYLEDGYSITLKNSGTTLLNNMESHPKLL
jgi:hypothetical protein